MSVVTWPAPAAASDMLRMIAWVVMPCCSIAPAMRVVTPLIASIWAVISWIVCAAPLVAAWIAPIC